MNAMSDNALMLKVKAGQMDKLGLLYERYSRALFGYFYRMTGNRSNLSEDLVQNVFYRMMKYRHTFKEDGHFRAWMYQMARNVFADEYRKPNPIQHSQDIDTTQIEPDQATGIEQQIAQQEEVELLHAALKLLSHEKREVLILSRFQQMKYHEIAEVTNSTEGAVKVRVYRAMQELKRVYQTLQSKTAHEQ
ncbi:RNA polymerase sigma factor [Pontibacter sp. G13]|uniref:RNA polymerase sigma factor n=1 Tax=Pontibacter sp. G13 TaxID=3074898 RepID=UPI00288C3B4F|nr:RNA polymerase sigma factor [Pontibacter sp. G13]WNJ17290.1 RNA polymerase sigma factor [Pontibacter sp. G13]